MRNLYTLQGKFICQDISELLGFYPSKLRYPLEFVIENRYLLKMQANKGMHIDTNCYMFTRKCALEIAYAWYSGIHNDVVTFEQLRQIGARAACTHHFTVNYLLDPAKQESALVDLQKLFNCTEEEIKQLYYCTIKEKNRLQFELFNNLYPWQAK